MNTLIFKKKDKNIVFRIKTAFLSLYQWVKTNIVWLLVLFLVAKTAYDIRPLEISDRLFPNNISQDTSWTCHTHLEALLSPGSKSKEKNSVPITNQLINSTSFFTVSIKSPEELEIKSNQRIKMGHINPAKFEIFKNNKDKLIATSYTDSPDSYKETMDVIVLDKKSGFGVWTQAGLSFFSSGRPAGQIHYLDCY